MARFSKIVLLIIIFGFIPKDLSVLKKYDSRNMFIDETMIDASEVPILDGCFPWDTSIDQYIVMKVGKSCLPISEEEFVNSGSTELHYIINYRNHYITFIRKVEVSQVFPPRKGFKPINTPFVLDFVMNKENKIDTIYLLSATNFLDRGKDSVDYHSFSDFECDGKDSITIRRTFRYYDAGKMSKEEKDTLRLVAVEFE